MGSSRRSAGWFGGDVHQHGHPTNFGDGLGMLPAEQPGGPEHDGADQDQEAHGLQRVSTFDALGRVLAEDVLALIPKFLERPTVLGIGEIGLNKNSKNEINVLERQLAMAAERNDAVTTPASSFASW